MNERNAALTAVVAVVVVGVVLVGAYVLGFGSLADDVVPNIGHSNPLDGTQAENNATNSSGGSTGGGGGGGNGAAAADGGTTQQTSRFTFQVREIESCGTTCRDVTVAAKNTGDEPATDVKVVTKLYAKDDKLWQGQETFAHVDGGETKVRTKRINLGYFDAAKVQQNDGYVTVKTTVRWDGGSETFSERRKVA